MFTAIRSPWRLLTFALLATVLALPGFVLAQATAQKQTLSNGMRIMREGEQNVYLVMDGRRHLIPDQMAYRRLFKNWDGITRDNQAFRQLKEGEPLSSQVMLAKSANSDVVYLLDGLRHKHPIGSLDTFNKLGFAQDNIVIFPPDLINPVPNAPAIE